MPIKDKGIGEIWCDWNEKKITGDEFAYEFGKRFEKELLRIWRKRQKLKKRILEEMVKEGRML